MKPLPRLHQRTHEELFKITDEVRLLSLNPESLSDQKTSDICRSICRALTMSLDNGLAEAITIAGDVMSNPGVRKEADAIIGDAELYFKFLQFERNALIEAGALPATATDVCERLSDLRSKLVNYRLNSPDVISAIREFRSSACQAADESASDIQHRKQLVREIQQKTFVYGTSVAVANCVITAATLGASVIFSGLSVTAGGLLAGVGAKAVDKTDKPRRT